MWLCPDPNTTLLAGLPCPKICLAPVFIGLFFLSSPSILSSPWAEVCAAVTYKLAPWSQLPAEHTVLHSPSLPLRHNSEFLHLSYPFQDGYFVESLVKWLHKSWPLLTECCFPLAAARLFQEWHAKPYNFPWKAVIKQSVSPWHPEDHRPLNIWCVLAPWLVCGHFLVCYLRCILATWLMCGCFSVLFELSWKCVIYYQEGPAADQWHNLLSSRTIKQPLSVRVLCITRYL